MPFYQLSSSYTQPFAKSSLKLKDDLTTPPFTIFAGIDLVAEVIPRICGRTFRGGGSGGAGDLPVTVDFIVAGDGPKRILLEEAIEMFGLQSRVTMLGELRLSQMRDSLLVRGDIFLNTSLTEAFCMAIVEAASCGLVVVSTKAGFIFGRFQCLAKGCHG